MNRPSRFSRLRLVLLFTAFAACVGLWQHGQTRRVRQRTSELRAELAALQSRRAATETELVRWRDQLEEQRRLGAVEASRLATLVRESGHEAEAPLWTEPPARVPDWNPASPYVWLRKESLPSFPVPVFDEEGRLVAGVASVLMVPPETLRRLNGRLAGLLDGLHAEELAHAEPSDEHLPGVAEGKGERLTIKVPALPDVGARLKAEFEAALSESLGPARADLVQRTAAGWLDMHFSQFGSEPSIISVLRHPEGTFNVSKKSGFSSMSVGGPTDIRDYIPVHLRPLFAPLTEPKP